MVNRSNTVYLRHDCYTIFFSHLFHFFLVTAPPPSYAECAFGRQDIRDENHDEHTSGDTNWAPAYPYYDWSRHSNMMFGGETPGVARPNPPDYDQI